MKIGNNKILGNDIKVWGLSFYSSEVKEARSKAISIELNQLHETLVSESELLRFDDEAFDFINTLKSLKK